MNGFLFSLVIVLFFGIPVTSSACTDFKLTAQDGTILITRSMEFGLDMQSNLISAPRGNVISNTTPNGKQGLTWKAKYGSVYLDGLGTRLAIDGMNEAGLSIEGLYLPGYTQYQTVPPGKEKQALAYFHFGDWVLGNFKTIDEVKQALNTVYVYSESLPQFKNTIFPLHFSIFDNTGKGIIVEFVAGKMNVYDSIGILTNSPIYSWHTSNLNNYLNLSPYSPDAIINNNITYIATGTGTGMLGLPGDVSPPSRFIKIAALIKYVIKPKNAEDAVNLAQHIINTVDIPVGFVRQKTDPNAPANELTQWVVFKDLTHKVFYYRTYSDLTLRAVDLTRIDFSENSHELKMPIATQQKAKDMTTLFSSSQ